MKKITSVLCLLLSIMMFVASGCAPAATDSDLAVKPDVIVVGGGMAGLTAAVRASELGAKVVLFEKLRLGGTGYMAGGSLSGAGYEIQKAAGIEDSPEKFFQDFIDMGGGLENLNEEIARKHAQESGPAIDWIQNYVEMSDKVDHGSYLPMNTMRVTYTAGGSAAGNASYFVEGLTAKLDEYVQKGTAQILLETEVEDIILDDKGDVIGVIADGKEYHAPSIIIATGGYGYSEKWLKEFAFTNVTSFAITTATGSGYDFARKAGGIFDNMDYCAAYAGSIPVQGFQAALSANVAYEGVVWLNTAGERVMNEPIANSGDRDRIWRTTDQNIIYVLVSENMLKDDVAFFRPMMGLNATYENMPTMNELIEKGLAFKADSFEDLAHQLNIPGLVATMNKYNEDAKAGKDTVFGRTDGLIPFEGTIYAVKTVPYILMTQGGPRIDADGQLVREDGSKIGNVYLAGEIIGSANVAGHSTIGGIGNGLCITWGKISAESAVKNAGVN
jgi:succinate dehydrogenase/fumarate reductase flavoprotein subunit